MHSTLVIAQKDLKTSYSSGRTWIIAFVFLIFMGVFFFNYIESFLALQKSASEVGGIAPKITELISALFEVLQIALLLVIPAITMGTFAEERTGRTLKILLSAPISSRQIVLGKFFSCMMIMGATLLLSLLYPAFLMIYGTPDLGILISSYLGFFLLITCQISFGIWISSFAKTQFTAFIFTIFGMFLLMIMNLLSQAVKGSELSFRIIRYLGYSDHLNSFYKGMITLADVCYFIAFTLIFLFFSIVSIDAKRWS